ncbi:PEP-CTERM sorting domain-containing protein [Geomonas oryzisoli]|uniref:PEP-CTERM sorting domain-containing protein n=1 Tax=Geomonas oryzisoli TaxID=2847992 RepID=A0ABX8JAR9_9BACT|nr:PEP-CTERM sorting domain-containing protein [Geomonas oryzisoli]QWV94207.1 PEP-CTERM sorting domain-containing protein [Geomonas oryzisoli]
MRRTTGALAVITFILALMTTSAHALSIRLTDGGANTVTIADNGVGDINPMTGAVTYLGSIGAYIANVTTGFSYPILGTPAYPRLDLGSIDVSGGSDGTNKLYVYLTDTGFTGAYPGFAASIGGTSSGTVKYSTYFDAGNIPFAMDTLLTEELYSGPIFSDINTAAAVGLDVPYSLTEALEITHTGFGATSFNAELAPVPEPGTFLLLGTGLMGLAIYGRRRARG